VTVTQVKASPEPFADPQRKMMGKAGRYHAVRGLAVAIVLAVATFTGLTIRGQVEEQRKATYADGLVQSLLNSDTAQVPAIVSEMAAYPKWTDPRLTEENAKAAAKSRPKLHTSLALLPWDSTQVDFLFGRLLGAKPQEVPVIRDALEPHKERLVARLWAVAERPEKDKEPQRLRAAAALAQYDPESRLWAEVQEAVGDDLVKEPAVYLTPWMDLLRPVRLRLLAPLSAVFGSSQRREFERSLATDILADYAADQPQVLADLVMDADVRQFASFFSLLQACGAQGLPVLPGEIDKKLPAELPSSDARREKQANAAAALEKMNRPAQAWPALKHSPDPRARSYLIHRVSPLGVDAASIIRRLDEEDVTIRWGLLLSLGVYDEKVLPPEERQRLLPKLQAMYCHDADPGLHGAAAWQLRTWQQEAWLEQVTEEWSKNPELREERLRGIEQLVTKDKEKAPPQCQECRQPAAGPCRRPHRPPPLSGPGLGRVRRGLPGLRPGDLGLGGLGFVPGLRPLLRADRAVGEDTGGGLGRLRS
jgi:hypothetical protein